MPLGDGDFHPAARAEGSAIIARDNDCLSAAIQKVLELWEDVLAGKKKLEKEFVFRVAVAGCDLFTRGFCVLTCDEGVSIAVGRVQGRRVVLAISTFADLSSEAVSPEAELDAARRAVARIGDI